MSLPEIVQRFVKQSPLPVMVRGLVERAFSEQVLDHVFDTFAVKQQSGRLLFSTCVALMASVVTRVQPTLGAAMRTREELLPVDRRRVYEKIAGLEDDVVSAAVAVTAADQAAVIDEMGGAMPPLVPGLRTLVLDGNHLRAVQHRIKPLRGLQQAALPGTVVALLDADRRLIVNVFLQQDGHSSELLVLPAVAATLQPGDLLLADRGFCARQFAADVEDRGAYFLLRQHKAFFPVELLEERVYVGDTETGRVYEQPARYKVNGKWRRVRRITVELHKATRNQDNALHLLTNLPDEVTDPDTGETVRVDALTIAEGYRVRWKVENAFHTMTVDLRCELNTLGYPPAALFGFCVAAMCYNAYQTAIAALRGHFGAARVEQEFSTYYIANDVRAVWDGMQLAVDEAAWSQTFGHLSLAEFAQQLLRLAGEVNPSRYRKSPTRARKPPVKGASKRAKAKHTSVAKEIEKHKKSASIP